MRTGGSVAPAAAERAGWLPQNVLLVEEADADDVADAISKIQAAFAGDSA